MHCRMDVTVAFMSRRSQRLPPKYLHHLTNCENTQDWGFPETTGCPIAFVTAMARLAGMASMYQKAARMGWAAFDDITFRPEISKIRDVVKAERPFLCDRTSDDQRPDWHQNRYHCVEAWRKAILLYTYRIFDRQNDADTPSTIFNLAHGTIDHIRLIARSDEIQKQVLLPVFLAGAEMRTERNRDFVRHYCEYWNKNSESGHFWSAMQLLEVVWRLIDAASGTNLCWADRVTPRDWLSVISGCDVLTSEVPAP